MKDLVAEFNKFDQANPKVWNLFKIFCQQAINAGKRKASAQLVIERLRWDVWMATTSDDDYKLNNNHVAYYARKWMSENPEYPKFFELRRVRGKAGWDGNGQGRLF